MTARIANHPNSDYSPGMTKMLEKAIAAARGQSPEVQDLIGQLVHDALTDEREWDRLFADRRSEVWLSGQAAEVRAAIRRGETTAFDPDKQPE